MLNELDKELESRGQRFIKYADDCVIVVKSKAVATIKETRNWNETSNSDGKDGR